MDCPEEEVVERLQVEGKTMLTTTSHIKDLAREVSANLTDQFFTLKLKFTPAVAEFFAFSHSLYCINLKIHSYSCRVFHNRSISVMSNAEF